MKQNNVKTIKYKIPSYFNSKKHSIVNIDIEKFDKEWEKSYFFVSSSESSLINPYKMKFYQDKIKNSDEIEIDMPEAKSGYELGKKIIGILDGKHRYILSKENGNKFVPMMIIKKQENLFKHLIYKGSQSTSFGSSRSG